MANNDSDLLNQERQRRKRISRMKTGIVMTIAIWMLVSLLAIIILSVQVFKLSQQLADITDNGFKDAQLVAEMLTNQKIDAIYTSNFYRCKKTAQIFNHDRACCYAGRTRSDRLLRGRNGYAREGSCGF